MSPPGAASKRKAENEVASNAAKTVKTASNGDAARKSTKGEPKAADPPAPVVPAIASVPQPVPQAVPVPTPTLPSGDEEHAMFCDLRCGNCLGEDAIPTICVDLTHLTHLNEGIAEDAIPTICVDLTHLTHLNEGTAVRTAVRTETDLTNSKNSRDCENCPPAEAVRATSPLQSMSRKRTARSNGQ